MGTLTLTLTLTLDAQEAAHYTLQARWSSDPALPLCPGDCGGPAAGTCQAPGSCTCASDRGKWRGGRWCEGPLALLAFGAEQRSTLAPGQWAYYEVGRSPATAAMLARRLSRGLDLLAMSSE